LTELEPELLLPVVERGFVPLLVLGFVGLELEELVVGCDVVSRLDGLGLSADAVVSSSFFVAEGAVWPTFLELLSGAFMEVDVVLAVLALLVERAEDSRDVVLRRDESRVSFWAREAEEEAEEEVVRLVLLGFLFEDVEVEAVAAGAVVSRSRDGGLGELEERFALYRDWTTFTADASKEVQNWQEFERMQPRTKRTSSLLSTERRHVVNVRDVGERRVEARDVGRMALIRD
jgi:hypothetical protein